MSTVQTINPHMKFEYTPTAAVPPHNLYVQKVSDLTPNLYKREEIKVQNTKIIDRKSNQKATTYALLTAAILLACSCFIGKRK